MLWLSACLVAAVVTVVVLRAQWLRTPTAVVTRVGAGALATLVALSTVAVFAGYNPTVDQKYFYPRTPLLADVAAVVGDEQAIWLGRGRLPAQANLAYALHTPDNYDALGVETYDALYLRAVRDVLRVPTAEQLRLLRVLGVRYIVAGEFDGLAVTDGLARIARIPPLGVYAVSGSLPRYSVVGSARGVRSNLEAQAAVSEAGFDPSRELVLEGDVDRAGSGAATGQVRVVEQQAEHVVLDVDATAEGWLLSLQTWFPGWQARIDGRRVPVRRANGTFQAVAVPAGVHRVTFDYRPGSVRAGLALTAVAAVDLALVLGYAGGTALRQRRRRLRA